MGQALYRKYRSKTLDTVVGQEHITTTLAHALKSGTFAHAYLFTGPRGTGKTSIARILAHEINGLPYEDDSAHLDIIEIDAASNRRIDEIRELRDKVNVAPAIATYKVYIIDEVHMLTREAFNALLKTLEEPPAHVVFMLATTEVHKLPETIVSRTQRFMLKPVELSKVAAHLRTIADGEGITIDDEALAMIAAHGEGSFRDSISLLDQTRGHDGAVDAAYVRQLIGQPSDEAVIQLQQAMQRHDAAATTTTLSQLRDQGFAAPQVAKKLAQSLRQGVLDGIIPHGVFDLLHRLLNVPAAHQPEAYLELALLEHALAGQMQPPTAVAAPVAAASAAPVTAAPPVPPPRPKAVKPVKPAGSTAYSGQHGMDDIALSAPPASARANDAADENFAPNNTNESRSGTSTGPGKALDATVWPEILSRIKTTHNTLYGIVRMAMPDFKGETVELYFKFAFHQKRVNEPKNRDILLQAIKAVTGHSSSVRCLVAAKDAPVHQPIEAAPATPPTPTAPQTVTDPATLAAINNIFGPTEILGS